MTIITESTKVGEILREYPELTDFFMGLGLCGCGYGPDNSMKWDIKRTAQEKGLDTRTLLDELNSKIQ